MEREHILDIKIEFLNKIMDILHKHTDNNKNDYQAFKLELWNIYFKLNDEMERIEYKKSIRIS